MTEPRAAAIITAMLRAFDSGKPLDQETALDYMEVCHRGGYDRRGGEVIANILRAAKAGEPVNREEALGYLVGQGDWEGTVS